MLGTSLPMLRLAAQIRRLAKTTIPVLVQGETGSGKELVARAIHDESPRSQGPYVAINAGAIPQELASAELFGHEKGAFTSAHARRDGAFLIANTGTLFLDEIAELGLDTQVKLLRVLEQREICPVGRSTSTKIDVRVVCATWADLNARVGDGRFREDLMHRLSVGVIRVPSLAERPSDIAALSAHFLSECATEMGPKRLSSAALGFLTAQRWPGNVRQLRNILSRAAVNAATEDIGLNDVIAATAGQTPVSTKMTPDAARRLVARCAGRVATAARVCGVPRSTFRGWLDADGQKEPPTTRPARS
jgi:DNA-binding NtrC family response regulator